ncbi:MAG TPA: PLP-dependent aminotransferase family protein, partial [Roseateles sp.]|nr:PLP-dependent aminotransferase family protein [Roseateles sp.]
LVAPFTQARSIQDGHSAQLSQAVTADFIAQGHFAAHLRLMRKLYRQRRWALLEALQPLRDWLLPQPSPGGLQLAALLPPGEEAARTRAAAAAGIATPPLSRLYLSAPRQDGWLLGYAALTPEEIRQAARALARTQDSPPRQ